MKDDITYTRTGTIQEIAHEAIVLEMTDTGERFVWPLPPENSESDISETLSVGEEVSLELHISDDPFPLKKASKDDEQSEKLRKMLEELLN